MSNPTENPDRSPPGPGRLPLPRTLGRVPLFWKILLANATVVGLGTVAGALAALSLGADTGAGQGAALVVGLLALAASILVNAALIRLALGPLEELQRTAEEVRAGRHGARAPRSRYADRALLNLVEAFNDMLDTLSRHRTRQQELARRVLEAEERERERIAHELYSRTAQTLAGVLVRLRVAQRSLDTLGSRALDEIREGVVDALEEIRGVARRLRPPELDELGLQVALEAHARSLTEGTRVEVTLAGDVPALPRETSLALFRILQEALTNAVLHGKPDSVGITFRTRGDRLVAEVADDGIGFDLEESLQRSTGSLGLFGMHERAGYLQGELSVESGPELGTLVSVSLPLGPEPEGRTTELEGAVERLMQGLVEPTARRAPPAARQETEPVTV